MKWPKISSSFYSTAKATGAAARTFNMSAGKQQAEFKGADVSTIESNVESFVLTSDHVKLIRRLVIDWYAAHSGAPRIDYEKHFGAGDNYIEMARILGIDHDMNGTFDSEQIKRFDSLKDDVFENATQIMLKYGQIEPGHYQLANIWQSRHPKGKCQIEAFSKRTFPIPKTEIIDFELTVTHIKLLRRLEWRYHGVDVKRPYGALMYYEAVMADALDIPVQQNEKGEVKLPREQLRQLQKLHTDMLFALPVFLQNAEVETGEYERQPAGYGEWWPKNAVTSATLDDQLGREGYISAQSALLARQYEVAGAGYCEFLRQTNWSTFEAPYAALLAYFSLQQAGKQQEAGAILDDASRKLLRHYLPHACIRYLRKDLDENRLLSCASNQGISDEELNWFLSVTFAAAANRFRARTHLAWMKIHSPVGSFSESLTGLLYEQLGIAPKI